MARVITFSRTFPAYHPKVGQPTFFVEKIWKGLYDAEPSSYIPFDGYWQRYDEAFPTGDFFKQEYNIHTHTPKHHTIRSGNRWKAGDYFSPRVWSAKPYTSPMISIAPDIKIQKVWDIVIVKDFKDTAPRFLLPHKTLTITEEIELAKNDGLTHDDLRSWFNKTGEYQAQIICWNKEIEY